jgi:hypothetical protein
MSKRKTPFMRGVTLNYCGRAGYLSSELARARVDRMVEANVDWVALIATVYQEHFHSYRQFADFEHSPQDDELCGMIDYLHGKGLKVKLRPMLQTLDGEHRNMIWFPPEGDHSPPLGPVKHWERWFAGLRVRVLHYARIAAATGCEMYGLDSEMDFTVLGRWRDDSQSKYWKPILQECRAIYDGHINYCAMLDTDNLRALRYENHWYHELDSLGLSFYPSIGLIGDCSKPTLMKRLASWEKDVVQPLAQAVTSAGLGFFFGECGCRSATDASVNPGGFVSGAAYAPEQQSNFLDVMCETFWDRPWWNGLFWWKWDEHCHRPHYHDDPGGEKGFVIDEKPAIEVMRKWYAKDRGVSSGALEQLATST